MFGLYMLAIYLGIAISAAGFVALLVVVALAVGLVTHPIRTLALLFHAVEEHETERHGIAVHLPGLQTAGIVALGVILDRHGTIAVLQQHEIEQLAAGPPVAVHERMNILEHRMEAGGPEQRMSAARVQPVDQGPQVVAVILAR